MQYSKRHLVFSFVILMLFVFPGCSEKTVSTPMADLPAYAGDARSTPDNIASIIDIDNTVEVKFMIRGYCYAGSHIKDDNALGGFGDCDNMPKVIISEAAKSSGRCYLLAQPTIATDFGGSKAMRLVLVNSTIRVVKFAASDSRLAIIQEAKDKSGNWNPIEYLPSSWCGNSFHNVFLRPGEYWAFPAVRYKGSFSTTLRFSLLDDDGKAILISNEFQGSINTEQFSIKQPYNPAELMDPYFSIQSGNNADVK